MPRCQFHSAFHLHVSHGVTTDDYYKYPFATAYQVTTSKLPRTPRRPSYQPDRHAMLPRITSADLICMQGRHAHVSNQTYVHGQQGERRGSDPAAQVHIANLWCVYHKRPG